MQNIMMSITCLISLILGWAVSLWRRPFGGFDTPSVGMETVYRDDIKCLDTAQLGITLAIENPLTKLPRKLSQIVAPHQ